MSTSSSPFCVERNLALVYNHIPRVCVTVFGIGVLSMNWLPFMRVDVVSRPRVPGTPSKRYKNQKLNRKSNSPYFGGVGPCVVIGIAAADRSLLLHRKY